MDAKYLDERTYDKLEIIFEEGDTSSEMFIVQQGSVVVTKKVAGQDVWLATLERGDFFGEMSLLESLPRSATCRAGEPAKVLAIRTGELLMKLRRDPTFAFEMLQHMSHRIRYLHEQFAQLMETEKVAEHELAKLKAAMEYALKERG